MRIRVAYRTTYEYQRPASHIVQALRLTPRNHDGQFIKHWRVDVDVDSRLRQTSDPFGNRLHMLYADGPLTAMTVSVSGEAEVSDTAGIVTGTRETLASDLYLRSTPLTAIAPPIAAFADVHRDQPPLAAMHALMAALHVHMQFDTSATEATTDAAAALEAGRGVCQDFAHIFIAAARHLGLPARYVSGHLARSSADQQDAGHAWAEVLVPECGWVAFDPANSICTTDHYLRVAVGLDYLDVAPVRGARRGGGEEAMTVAVRAIAAMQQSQD